ncbi:hypothetical protein LWI28_020411 [Acer negundo]|uniref:Uncharacterized protein n=1 Tax=Acer negundo TaxID=4023 RepID=A0AAD5NSV5_ACENE|nr:hypothetical protein LWI28_020411 [Acer negundo]
MGRISLSQGFTNTHIYVSIISIWNFLGRVGGGYFSEIIVRKFAYPRPVTMAMIQAIMAFAFVYYAMDWPGQIYIVTVMIGIGLGAQWAIAPASAPHVNFSNRNHDSLIGSCIFAIGVLIDFSTTLTREQHLHQHISWWQVFLTSSRHGWNVAKLSQVLAPVDVEAVLTIPTSWNGGHDTIRWHYDKTGEYMVNSGYRLAIEEHSQASVFNPTFSCLNDIPSMENLWKKNIVKNTSFNRSNSQVESFSHAIFGCKVAKSSWLCTNFLNHIVKLRNFLVMEVFIAMATKFPNDLGQMCMIS